MSTCTTEDPTNPLDNPLMQAIVQDRSEQALTTLYQRYGHILKCVILRVMKDESDADDVLQEVMLQVWTKAETYSPSKGHLLGWLITLARRRALDRIRQRCSYNRARTRFEAESKSPLLQEMNLSQVDQQICSEDLRNLLARLLQKLPPQQGQVVQMSYLQGLSQRQIAAKLDLPLGTVKTRIELGMRKLFNSLRPLRKKVA